MRSVLDCIKKRQFPPTGEPDTRTDGIAYKFNKQGYRTKEFNEIDWANSIVVFGGSDVLGEGIEEQDTLTAKIQSKTNFFTVNMGVGGASMQRSFYDSLLVAENLPLPKAIINIWAIHYRTINYAKKEAINNGPWNWDEPDNFMKHWIHEEGTNAVANALFTYMASRQVWGGAKSFHGSFFKPVTNILGIHMFNILDKCKDGIHPGPVSMEAAAEHIHKYCLNNEPINK